MLGSAAGGGPMLDEELNRREFEQARQAWLNSGSSGPAPSIAPAAAKPAGRKGSAKSSSTGSRLPAHTDLLQAETRKMDERLALLKRTLAAEKEKRATSASNGGSVAIGGGSRLGAPRASPSSSTLKSAPAGRYVAPRIDTRNTLLATRDAVAREREEYTRHVAAIEAERQRVAAAEKARLDALRAGGHTLVTYAQPEPAPTWVIGPDEEALAEAAMNAPPSMAIMGSAAVAGVGNLVGRAAPRKQVTAADMMRSKRAAGAMQRKASASSLSSSAAASSIAGVSAPVAAASAASASHPAKVPSPADRSQFNLRAAAAPGLSSLGAGEGTSSFGGGGGLMDGDLDEEANAAAFAQARLEFLRSIAADTGSDKLLTSAADMPGRSPDADPPAPSPPSNDAFAATLESGDVGALSPNWWEQAEPGSASEAGAGSDQPKPGLLLDGPAFDEAANAAEFAAARAQWLQQAESAARNEDAPASSSHAAAPIATSSSPAAPLSSSTTSASAAKSSCYNCYKLFPTELAFVDTQDPARRLYCTPECCARAQEEIVEACSGGCRRKVRRKDAKKEVGGSWTCHKCAARRDEPRADALTAPDAAGLPLRPSSTSPAAAPSGDASSPLLSLFGDDDLLSSLQLQASQSMQR